jgi:HK97 gp10 family phage protein
MAKNEVTIDASAFERAVRQKMERLGRNTRREKNRLGHATADRAASLAPHLTGTLAGSIEWQETGDDDGVVSASVPYAHFEEFGSLHNAPHPFMRPALDEASGNLKSPGYG